ncbi:MAG: hypothetical protein JWP91_1079, partial [Fibrobacteres bacterium]|nr:hypothetical protein [Fibrobacterota bacterium]
EVIAEEPPMARPDLFTYLDYRMYLRDAFGAMKAGDRKTSFRSFAKEAGYTSPNFLQLVIAGTRNLSTASLPGTLRALGLNKQESEFFANMVGFEQAQGFEEKNFHYQRMLRSRRYTEARPIDKGQYEYFEQWYNPVVREMLAHEGFTGEASWIARRIHPGLTVAQVERSIELLNGLGMIRKDEATGKWLQAEPLISTPAEVASLAVANYHRSVLKLASDSIEAFSPDERDLRAATLGIPKSAYPAIKRKMEELWREILAVSQAGGKVEEVYQVNLQVFPLTKPEGDGNA